MEAFLQIVTNVKSAVPDWVGLIVFPVAVAVLAVLFTLVGGRRAYVPLAVALGSLGFFFVFNTEDMFGFLYLALFAALAALCSLLFLIPCPRKKKREGREEKRRARDEAIYRKFHEDITPSEEEASRPGEEPIATAEECGTSLSHVSALLAKLKREKLSPADRLETEALTHTIEGYRGKALSEKELHLVNDCLATVLRLTAKYKL